MEVSLWVIVALMFVIAFFLGYRLYMDIKYLKVVENVNNYIIENNLTENSCYAYCLLTKCTK